MASETLDKRGALLESQSAQCTGDGGEGETRVKKVDCQQAQGRLKTKYKLQFHVHQYPCTCSQPQDVGAEKGWCWGVQFSS